MYLKRFDMESDNKNRKSIITDKPIAYQTPAAPIDPRVGWRVDDFDKLIQSQGYDAYIDRAMRCPCVDKATGQALSTCKNCLGRGWFFVDRIETRIIAQHMDSKKRYLDWGETNRGTASITTKGGDKVGFMDRIILLQLQEFYSEILRPELYESELLAYPVYEPLEISNIFLFVGDYTKLEPIPREMYIVDKNKIVFDQSLLSVLPVEDVNQKTPHMSISVRYSHYPVYHVIDVNRELMKVRESKLCSFDDSELKQMPINVLARKAHYIFDQATYGDEQYENTVIPE